MDAARTSWGQLLADLSRGFGLVDVEIGTHSLIRARGIGGG
jgi:hypothetical protein